MAQADAALLAALPGWAFAFMMVLARVGAGVMVMPALGETEIPTFVRAGIVLTLTFLMLPLVAPLIPPPPNDVWMGAGMIGGELLAGFWLGFLTRLVVVSLPIAGQFLSFMTGLANVLQTDAGTGQQITVLASLFGVVAPVLILASGAYMIPLSALQGSYTVIPPGTWLPAGDAADAASQMLSESVETALRLSAPFILANIVWQVSIGLLGRLAPSLHLFLVAMPGQVLGGLLLLAVLAASLLAAWDATVQAGYLRLPGLL